MIFEIIWQKHIGIKWVKLDCLLNWLGVFIKSSDPLFLVFGIYFLKEQHQLLQKGCSLVLYRTVPHFGGLWYQYYNYSIVNHPNFSKYTRRIFIPLLTSDGHASYNLDSLIQHFVDTCMIYSTPLVVIPFQYRHVTKTIPPRDR